MRFSRLFQVSLPQKCKSEKICQKKKTGIKHLSNGEAFPAKVFFFFVFFLIGWKGKRYVNPKSKFGKHSAFSIICYLFVLELTLRVL